MQSFMGDSVRRVRVQIRFLCSILQSHLPGDEIDKPEGGGVWPHVAQVGHGVEEGHVCAANGWVGNPGKECEHGDKS